MIYGTGEHAYHLVKDWLKPTLGLSFQDISHVAIDVQGRIYILSRSEQPIMVFDDNGTLLASWGKAHFKRAHGSCIGHDSSIYCTDDRNHTVTKFSTEGKILLTLGTKDKPSDTGYREATDLWERIASIKKGGPPFNRPTDVALSSRNEIFVADGYGNARIHRFSKDGEFLSSWGEPGSAPGQFRLPHSIWVDKHDHIWVSDRENNRIQIFDENGTFLRQWTDLIRPTDIFIDSEEIVYVSELCNRISIFTIDGELLSRWGNEMHAPSDPLFVAPHTIATDSKGNLYVGEVAMTHAKIDRGLKVIQKFQRLH